MGIKVNAGELVARLRALFPHHKMNGKIVAHDCSECSALNDHLTGATWETLTAAFIEEHDDILPLLSRKAYVALLPAWLMQAIGEPNGDVASMVLVNLRTARTDGFNVEQAALVVDCARFITFSNVYGPSDPVNVDSLVAIKNNWLPS